ncbi:hypothetical protein GPX89_08420 [Nocardia sp. ET3-3]|uniref:Uncharacterized protein n=1 Tax=Nocardia terrae TaxID=2675851 RepID=A0A7K1UTU2_9NOCA|nr:hypothetical protein [Nocardia terrae]MVU77268.1 hypothetical protein [Nocardia terrae]
MSAEELAIWLLLAGAGVGAVVGVRMIHESRRLSIDVLLLLIAFALLIAGALTAVTNMNPDLVGPRGERVMTSPRALLDRGVSEEQL